VKFSVIVADYNNGKFLPELVESIRSQTYANWELVIVDDSSTDESKEALHTYSDDPRINVSFHDKNMGAAAAFRSAARLATGEIIGMLGADDALMPTALESMIDVHQKYPNASLITSNLYKCDIYLNILNTYGSYKQPTKGLPLIRDVSVGSFATFKKTAYEKTTGFDPWFKKALDHDIYLKLEEVGDVIYLPEPLYLYRANPIGISQNDNWFSAALYSLEARQKAYIRRKMQNNELNLSNREYKELKSLIFLRKYIQSRKQRKLLPATIHFIQSKLALFL